MKRTTLRYFAAISLLSCIACNGAHDTAAPRELARPAPTSTAAERQKLREFAPNKPPDDTPERANLMNIAYGATVISRSGEMTLESSAFTAIDGNPSTGWTAAPGASNPSAIYALPTRTRIEKAGAFVPEIRFGTVTRFHLEVSDDATNFTPLATVDVKKDGLTLLDVPPTAATYIRVTVDATHGASIPPEFQSLQIRGTPLEPRTPRSLDGCWNVNAFRAHLVQRDAADARVFGSFAEGGDVLQVDGGSDGLLYRFAWIRGPQFGFAALAVSPEDKHLSGAVWHEEVIPLFGGGSWIGERGACSDAAPRDDSAVFNRFLQRVGRFPLYALQFDAAGNLNANASAATLHQLAGFLTGNRGHRFRLVAHEFRRENPSANRAFCEVELRTLRSALLALGADADALELVAAGSDQPRQVPYYQDQREMFSVVELELPQIKK
jgi:hypothetical protein